MRAYVDTFRRHRRLLIAPIVVAAIVAAWFTFGSRPAYRSTASLWINNGMSIESALYASGTADGTMPPSGPADLEQAVLTELLQTPSFDVAVAEGSLLPRFLAAGRSAGGFSPSVLLSHGSGGSPVAEAAESISTGVVASMPGPEVLALSYDGPSPAVARSVVQSLIVQIRRAAASSTVNIGREATVYDQRDLRHAIWAVGNNRAALTDYARDHPGSTVGNDTTYAALAAELQLANAQLSSIETASDQVATEAEGAGGGASIEVMDQPSLPPGPVRSLSWKLAGMLAGGFAGTIVSLLALLLMTSPPPLRWDAELPAFAGHGARRRGR